MKVSVQQCEIEHNEHYCSLFCLNIILILQSELKMLESLNFTLNNG